MIDDPVFYVLAVIAVSINGISKSGFGGGIGVLSVPLMALVIPPAQAAAILLPILVTMDFFGVMHYRKTWDKANLKILLPAAIVGIFLGLLFFKYLSESHIRIMIGGIAVLFSINFFLHKKGSPPKGPNLLRGSFWGVITGFVSFGVHAGGPPANMYLLPQKMDKSLFVGTTVVLFTSVNLVKLVPYTLLGQLSADNLLTSLVLLPLAPLGIWLGIRLHKIIKEELFYRFCYVFLVLTGTKLLYDGIKPML